MSEQQPLWSPSEETLRTAPLARFIVWCSERYSIGFEGYDAFHSWSIGRRGAFWSAVWDFCGVKGDKGDVYLDDDGEMLAARFFPHARLNFAEHLLAGSGADAKTSDALVFWGEDKVKDRWSWER